MIFVFLALLQIPDVFQTVRKFAPPTLNGEVVALENPYALAISPKGEVFVADRLSHRIHLWDPNGVFVSSFGEKHDGPGGIHFPYLLGTYQDTVWVWDGRLRMTQFTREGKALGGFVYPKMVRDFVVLDPYRILLAYQDGLDEPKVVLEIVSREGKPIAKVKEFANELYLSKIQGYNEARIRPFAPDLEIQANPDGTFLLGYSNTPELFTLNREGKLTPYKRFQLQRNPLSDDERNVYDGMDFPTANGKRISVKNFPGLKVDFDVPKGLYAHFINKEGRTAFIETPIGGLNGLGLGFHWGHFLIYDHKLEKGVAQGTYSLPKDSTVLYVDGRIFAFLLNEDEVYEFVEVRLVAL